MAKKEKENPYEIEQAVFDMDSEKLESISEKDLKKALETIKAKYSEKRSERLEKQKNFALLYTNCRKNLVTLMEQIKEGKLEVEKSIQDFKNYVNNEEWKTETE